MKVMSHHSLTAKFVDPKSPVDDIDVTLRCQYAISQKSLVLLFVTKKFKIRLTAC